MEQVSPYPRWIPLFLGFIINATVGMTTYSWSLFIKPLNAEFGWSRAEIALAFAICCFLFGTSSFLAGKLNDKFGPKRVVFAGGLLLGTGFALTGYIDSKIQLYLFYGLMAGAGAGLIYLPAVALAPRWWPDRRALATGVIVLGLGLGSFIMAPLSASIMENPDLGWRYVFRYCGVAMGIMACLAGLCLRVPPKDWLPAGWIPPVSTTVGKTFRDYTHAEAIRTPQFKLLYIAYFCCSAAGLLVIGHIAAYAHDKGLTTWEAAGIVSVFAIANAATRICSGVLVEFLGIRRYFLLISCLQVLALACLFPVGGSYSLLWITAGFIGWNYGAIFTLFPVYCVQYFGNSAQGSNYGLLFSSWGIAGLFGPFAGGLLKDFSGTYAMPFYIAAAIALVAVGAIALCKAPPQKHVEA